MHKEFRIILNTFFKSTGVLSALLTSTAFLSTFSITFLILFVIFAVKYYRLKKNALPAPSQILNPPWSKSSTSEDDFTLLAGNSFNTVYFKQEGGGSNISLTFPSAESVVLHKADNGFTSNEYYIIFLNNSSGTVTNFIAGTGNTKSGMSTLGDLHYIIIRVDITNETLGSEAVSYTGIASGNSQV